eukprot:gene12787-14098_t
MLLSLQKDSGQDYQNFVSNLQPNLLSTNQTVFASNYRPPSAAQVNHHHHHHHNHDNTAYLFIQPNLGTLPQQHQRYQPSLSIRSRKRRANHSLVSTMDPVAVARRNERERNRVKQVNDGFNELRKKIPYIPEKKKFSKVEILRFAMLYIRELQVLINNASSCDEGNSEGSSEKSKCSSECSFNFSEF